MLRLTHHLEAWIKNGSFRLLMLAGFILLIWGSLAPVSTLIWWVRQGKENLGMQKHSVKPAPTNDRPTSTQASGNCYIIFLPGVGDFSANQLTPGEEWFLDQLVQQHPGCVSVRDIFPYSVFNKDLAGERFMAPLWKAAERADGWLENADALIKIRNLWRFAISADDRYGPIYNQGIADTIINRMNAIRPISLSTQKPLKLILIGTSGGAQVALGAAYYLDKWLNNPKLYVVSVGGDFSGETGFDTVEHVYHLQGERDWIEDLSTIVFPSRWRWVVGSPFNRARRQNRFTVINSGPQTHDGNEGYFGMAVATPENTTYVQLTLQKVTQLPIWSEAQGMSERVPNQLDEEG